MGLFGKKQSYEDDPEYQKWLADAKEYDEENRRLQKVWAEREEGYAEKFAESAELLERQFQLHEASEDLLQRERKLQDEGFEVIEMFRQAALRLHQAIDALESRNDKQSQE